MRKLLLLSLLTILTAGVTGCASDPCGGGWHPGYFLGRNRQAQVVEYDGGMSGGPIVDGGCGCH
jgi:hypothetical protein